MTLGKLTVLCFNFICTGTVALFALFLMYRAYGHAEEREEQAVGGESKQQKSTPLPRHVSTTGHELGSMPRVDGERKLAEEYFSWAKKQRELTAQ